MSQLHHGFILMMKSIKENKEKRRVKAKKKKPQVADID